MDLIKKQRKLRKELVLKSTIGYSVPELNKRSNHNYRYDNNERVFGFTLGSQLQIEFLIKEKLLKYFQQIFDFPPKFLRFILSPRGLSCISQTLFYSIQNDIDDAVNSMDEDVISKDLQKLYIEMMPDQGDIISQMTEAAINDMTNEELGTYAMDIVMRRKAVCNPKYRCNKGYTISENIQWLGSASYKQRGMKQVTVYPSAGIERIGFRLNITTEQKHPKYSILFDELVTNVEFQALKGDNQFCVDQFGNSIESLRHLLAGVRCSRAPMVLKFADQKNEYIQLPVRIQAKTVILDGTTELNTLPDISKDSLMTINDLDILSTLEEMEIRGTVNLYLTATYSRMPFRSRKDVEMFVECNQNYIWTSKWLGYDHLTLQPIGLEVTRTINIQGCCDGCRNHVSFNGLKNIDTMSHGHCVWNKRVKMLMCCE